MAGKFSNLVGTVLTRFRLGKAGPEIVAEGQKLGVKDASDNYAAIRAMVAEIIGDSVVLNADAAEGAADWTFTVARPTSGMTQNIRFVLPGGSPSPGQVLSVVSNAAGTITLGYVSASDSSDNTIHLHEETISFGSTSPVDLFTKPANAVVTFAKVIVDTPYDGAPELSVGIAGETSKYVPSTYIDLTAPSGTVFDIDLGNPMSGVETLLATYSAGGASVGEARIQIGYSEPSVT